MSLELKIAIVQSGIKSYKVAAKIGWHPSKLSCVINGVYEPTADEKYQLANVLGVKIGDIFPEREGA